MPEVTLSQDQRRIFEQYDNTEGSWNRFRIERFAIDGKILVTPLVQASEGDETSWRDEQPLVWKDLSKAHYRWIL
jgi:hypothetical protein